ncbi:nucleotide exchange factor GrpE [Verrucomicrobiota bacterium]
MSTEKSTEKESMKKTVLEEQLEHEIEEQLEHEGEEPAPTAEEVVEEEEPLKLQFMRLQADFDNYRKRVARERTELYTRANQDLIEELLPVVDHYEMGLENAEKHEAEQSVLNGFKMVYDQMQGVLKKYNVTAVESIGKEFDPHTQEAVSHLPSAEYAENVVMAQVRCGYMIGDKLLRAAQVVVSSGNPSA